MSVVATASASAVTSLSPLVLSVLIAICVANVVEMPGAWAPGIAFGSRSLLRAGVVLLGFRLSLSDLSSLGPAGLAGVIGVVLTTFVGTQLIARALGASKTFGLLLATGYAICGASAIAAMTGVVEADEEETAYAIALVTLCGSLSIFVLPPLGQMLALNPRQFGNWVGAAVHDVGQVVATASTAGAPSVEVATLIKLTRVVMLAPIVAAVSVRKHRKQRHTSSTSASRYPLVPLFVIGFLAAVSIRSTGVLSHAVIDATASMEKILLSLALAGLGFGVHLRRLRVLGAKPLLLGLLAWLLVAGTAYAETRLVGPH